jgi:hypothetical protein
MGLFSKILPYAEIVGGAVMIATGVGAVAGGLLITEGLVSSGAIGGSVGKFLKSDAGQGLMLAVGMGATAYSMFGQDALQTAATTENAGVADTAAKASSAAATDQSVQAAGAANTGDLVKTGVSFSNSAGVNTAGFVDQSTAAYNGAPMTEMTGSSAVADNISPQANLAQTQAIGADQGAVAQASGQSMPGMGNETGGVNSGSPPATQPSAAPPESTGPVPGPNMPDASTTTAGAPDAAGHAAFQATQAGSAADEGSIFDKMATNPFLNSKFGSAAIQGGASAIGGLGQGMMQEAAMNKQIAALQEPNRSFGGPGGQNVLTSSQSPITVPSGYLQRAQALKSMLNSNGAGATPSASSPVPVWSMNSTPRGGMPGG